ncbi:phage Gp37/Gp68 family protein [Ensifer sp. LCM 4579]|uniref:phage Gp37/Gp68 family protein n=1 Tax=Ensifer sp. LCM 4579 TaxID=1848292 RepID=UPI0008D8E4DD|nr:phage Gp37/Gp68 family protein [Ensifer sp. LCM 4579]OHV85917.1 hypothetical protein LCM4579_00720 [Ensifer sp. LCM 4579]
MADNTKIEWTDATWNPITGCAVVSPGCTNCYAMKLAGTRLKNHPSRKGLTKDTKARGVEGGARQGSKKGNPVWTGEMRFNREWLDQPLKWTKPRMIFVCAHGDLFAEGVPDEWIDQVFAIMPLCPQHTFQVLTKRPDRMRDYLTGKLLEHRLVATQVQFEFDIPSPGRWPHLPLPNVWLGVSVEDQKSADERIPLLLDTPAAIRWISAEPLLGPVDLTWVDDGERDGCRLHFDALTGLASDGEQSITGIFRQPDPKLDWVVAGGESGADARPMHPDWARALRDQCTAAGVPFLFKQWGQHKPVDITIHDGTELAGDWDGTFIAAPNGEFKRFAYEPGRMIAMLPVSKKAAGRLLDGIEHNGFPEVRR